MSKTPAGRAFRIDRADVRVFLTEAEAGLTAGRAAAAILREAIAKRGRARVIVATGRSQDRPVATLVAERGIDWKAVEVFHMDEFVGVPADHPASFRRWLKARVADVVRPGKMFLVEGDAPDTEAECLRYEALLKESPVDLCLAGFGENGHIAFNDPHNADFRESRLVKAVDLDVRSRRQQVGEKSFPRLDDVPLRALTITCPAILACLHLVATVPEARKAAAVRAALEGPVGHACPATLVRIHPNALVFLDGASAAGLDKKS
ncbi:MAG: 6-phosphogluconolactonase [Planctomycetota bacterium]